MSRSAVMLLLLVGTFCATVLAAPGGVDDSQRDYNVPGKEPAAVTADDFKSTAFKGFDLNALRAPIDAAKNPGGFGVPINQNTFPTLNFAGVSIALVVYNKGGQNTFHTHARGNELLTVIEGSLDCELIDTAGTLFKFTLNKGDVGYFPQGLMHLQQNTNGKETIAMQAFSSANPGTQRIVPALFAGSPEAVSVSMNNAISPKMVTDIKGKLVPGFTLAKKAYGTK